MRLSNEFYEQLAGEPEEVRDAAQDLITYVFDEAHNYVTLGGKAKEMALKHSIWAQEFSSPIQALMGMTQTAAFTHAPKDQLIQFLIRYILFTHEKQ